MNRLTENLTTNDNLEEQMQAIVSNLVARYECGGLTRRQLISGIAALVAIADVGFGSQATAQSSGIVSANALKVVVAETINHVGINVTDVGRSVEWYSKIFGLKVIVEAKDVAVLGFRDGGLSSTTFVFRAKPKPEINHVMFGIDNFDATALADYLKEKGLAPREDVLSFHVTDPDGIDVQVGNKALHPSETVLRHK